MRVLYSSAVWNGEYVNRFLGYGLPNLLSDGNLGGLANASRDKFLLITSRRDKGLFLASPVFGKLRDTLETEILFMEDFTDIRSHHDKYSTMSACQIEAIRRSSDFDAIVLGYADFIWSEGSLKNALARIEAGHDGVFCPGLPVAERAFCQALRDHPDLWRGDTLTVPSRMLVELSLRHLHSLALANNWNRPVLSKSPAYQIWDVPGQGIAMRWFHLHPAVLRTHIQGRHIHREYSGSLDDAYMPLIFDSTDRIYFATDSDEICFCSIMQDWEVEEGTRPLSVATLASWAENNAALLHREFFNQTFLYHMTEIDRTAWAPALAKSDWVARQVEKRLLIPDSVLALMDPEAFGDRRARQERYSLRFPSWPGTVGAPTGATPAPPAAPAKTPAAFEIVGATESAPPPAQWSAHGASIEIGSDATLALSEVDGAGEHFAAIAIDHAAGSPITARVHVRPGERFNLRLYLIADSDSGYADFHLYGTGHVFGGSAFGDAEILATSVALAEDDGYDCSLSIRVPETRTRTTLRVQMLEHGRGSIYPGSPGMGFTFGPCSIRFIASGATPAPAAQAERATPKAGVISRFRNALAAKDI